MLPVRMPVIVRRFYNDVLWQMPREGRKIYLTFDDGPIPQLTPWVLDQLENYNAKATFFCLGENVKKYPDLFGKILNQGHAVGNHSMNHYNGWFTNQFTYLRNIEICSRVMEKYMGQHKNTGKMLFRPPYGKISFAQVKALRKKYKIVMWDVLSFDYNQALTGEQCFRNVEQYARSGSIVVFHDSLKAEDRLRYCLPKVLEHFADRNYVFSSIPV